MLSRFSFLLSRFLSFWGIHFSQRHRSYLQGTLQVSQAHSGPLPSRLFVVAHALGSSQYRPERNEAFLHIKENQSLGIYPVKHWLLRPLQGIGVGLIFEQNTVGSSNSNRVSGVTSATDPKRAV